MLALALELGLLAVALVAAWLVGRSALTAVSPTGIGLALGVAATLPLLLLLGILRRSSWAPVVHLRAEVDHHLLPVFKGCTWWQLAAIAAAAGLGEEVLFRGLLQGLLSEFGGLPMGLLGASALFGLAHMITPTYAVLAGVVGLYLGWLAMASDGLWIPIVAHAAYDLVALITWVRGADPKPPPSANGPAAEH